MSFLRRHALLFVVFLTGAASLVIEVVALRLLSPYFGNTIYAASSVIGVILAALSVGYYVGGTQADRHPSRKRFFAIILASGLAVLLIEFLAVTLLPRIGYRLSLAGGPLVSSIALFFLPAALLGTLSPFAIKLESLGRPTGQVGSIAGAVFFWSTFGSIAGTLSAGFLLIPHVGVHQIIILTGLILGLLGLVPLTRNGLTLRSTFGIGAILIAVTVLLLQAVGRLPSNVVFRRDGVYEQLTVVDVTSHGRPARVLFQDRTVSGGIYRDGDDDLFAYSRYAELARFVQPNSQRALVLGGGVATVPKSLLRAFPDLRVDVVEIEPSLPEVARQYFGVPDDSRLETFIEDGRRFLHDTERRYDFIFSDVYATIFSVPSHMTTAEFFALMHDRLAPGGLAVVNFIGSLDPTPPSLALSATRTFRSVFPDSAFYAVESPDSTSRQNIIFTSAAGPGALAFDSAIQNEFLKQLPRHQIDLSRYDLSRYALLTDNYAPVERLATGLLRSQ